MSKLISINMLIFLVAACGEDDDHNQKIAGIHSQLTDDRKLVPGPPVQCIEYLEWHVGNFADRTLLPLRKHRFNTTISAYADTALVSKSSGFGSFKSSDLTDAESKTCNTICENVVMMGGFADHKIIQNFDLAQAIQLIKSDHSFHPIKEGSAMLTNSQSSYGSRSRTKYLSNVSLPAIVDCENEWLVRSDSLFPHHAIFMAPEGKCLLSVDDHELELPSGQKVLVTLRGYYKKDDEMPTTRTEVKFTSLSFKYLN